MLRILENCFFQMILTFLTIYTLFSDDIRVIFFREPSDSSFDTITIIALICFIVEIVFSCLTIEGYYKSFFMWLDIISTISLFFDLQFLFGDVFSENSSADSSAKVA